MDYYDLIERQEITSYEIMMLSQPFIQPHMTPLDMWVWWINLFNPLTWFI